MAFKPKYSKRLNWRTSSRPQSCLARKRIIANGGVIYAGTQLDNLSSVLSFEEPAGYDPETDEDIPLGDMLTGNADDPAMAASRFVDWEDFLGKYNPRYEAMVTDFALGKSAKHTADRFGLSSSWAHIIKGFWLGIWTGASRYIHCDWLRQDETLAAIFGYECLPSQSTYSRFLESSRRRATRRRAPTA